MVGFFVGDKRTVNPLPGEPKWEPIGLRGTMGSAPHTTTLPLGGIKWGCLQPISTSKASVGGGASGESVD